MLVSLSISQWAARKHDKRASRDVAEHYGTREDVGRYTKALVARDSLRAIQTAAGAARTEHYRRTLPWSDDGARILMAAGFQEYAATMSGLRDTFEREVRAFVLAYPDFVRAARVDLNGLFVETDYPSTERVEAKFSFSTGVLPLPDAADFRVDLGDSAVERIRGEIGARMSDTVNAAAADAWRRLYDGVEHMAERLKAFEAKVPGNREGAFRDSLVENLVELTSILPSLNIKGDPELDRLSREVSERLCTESAQGLRDNPNAARAVRRDAESILANMAGLMGPDEAGRAAA
tara:strand:+ start:47 stop:922 length:876 start_codon:yes stop_codon:yes gene_type:complete